MSNILKSLLLIPLMLCGCPFADSAETPAASSPASVAAAPASDPYAPEAETVLWKISKEGQPDSYLIGTMHIGKPDNTLPESFQAALNKSKKLILESESVDPAYFDREPEQALTALHLMSHERTLHQTLGMERLQKVHRMLTGSPVEEIKYTLARDSSKVAPRYIWLFLGYAFAPQGYSSANGIDTLLFQAAAQQGKPMAGLELFEAEVMLNELMDDSAALRGIDAYIKHEAEIRRDALSAFADYEQGRISKVWQETREEIIKYTEPQDVELMKNIDEAILKQRNLNWMPKLLQELPQQSTTVAVGMAHLFGEHGVIRLLRQNGYTVTPLPM